MPETLATEAGRKACLRPCPAPSTFAAATSNAGGPLGSSGSGSGAGKGECLTITRLSIASISSSVPKPKRFASPSEEAAIQRRWSRENGRSWLLEVTMYWRSSGPNPSSR